MNEVTKFQMYTGAYVKNMDSNVYLSPETPDGTLPFHPKSLVARQAHGLTGTLKSGNAISNIQVPTAGCLLIGIAYHMVEDSEFRSSSIYKSV